MGYANGGEIFNQVAREVMASEIAVGLQGHVLKVLADALIEADWDTVDESVREFDGDPVVTVALRKAQGSIGLDSPSGAWHELIYDPFFEGWLLKDADGNQLAADSASADGWNRLLTIWAATTGDPDDAERARYAMHGLRIR